MEENTICEETVSCSDKEYDNCLKYAASEKLSILKKEQTQNQVTKANFPILNKRQIQ